MFDMQGVVRPRAMALAIALVLGLSACGGGGGSNVRPSPPPTNNPTPPADPNFNVDVDATTAWPDDHDGTGALTKGGPGTLVVTGTNTYTGGTTIDEGTLQIGDGGTTGSIVGDVANEGSLVFNRSDDTAFGRVVSGSGSLAQLGKGRVTLISDNTYTGGTTIGNGTLQLGNGGKVGSIVGDVANEGSLAFNRSDDIAFGGIVSGSGSLAQIGAGRLILAGDNTYTGGTAISSGTLQLGNGGKVGSIAGDVANKGSLVFNRSDDISFGGVVSGSGSLAQLGKDRLTLTGDNTYTGGTTIGSGTLQLGNGEEVGSIVGDVVNGGSLVFNRSDDVTFEGGVSGTGSLTQAGSGSLILTGANTFTGGTTISQGILQIGNGGTTGSIAGNVMNNGTLVFKRYDDVSFGGDISGSGSLVLDNAGTPLVLTGTHTYTGGTIIKDGILQVGDGGTTGSIAGDVTVVDFDHGLLAFARSDDITFSGVISGNGSVLQEGTGTLELTGDNTYSGRTSIINGGVVQVSKDTNLGVDSLLDITKGTLRIGAPFVLSHRIEIVGSTFTDANGQTYSVGGEAAIDTNGYSVTASGEIFGTDSAPYTFIKQGAGSLTLTSPYDYFGNFTVQKGTLQFGDGGVTGQIDGDVTNNGALIFDRSDSFVFDGVISGSGSLTQEGSGTLTLTGTNTYAGGTTVAGGTLQSANILPGDVSVDAAAMLDGVSAGVPGVAGNLSNAGKVAVHNGDTGVDGNYIQASTGILAVSLGSKLDVSGKATLNGGTLEVTGADSGYVANTHTEVLTAGESVDGTFDQLVKDTGVVFTATTINYDANSVWLDTTGLNVTTAAAGGGVYYTPASMGSAERVQGAFEQLNAEIAAGHTDGMSSAFVNNAGAFQQSPNLRAAQASLESLSGQLHAASAAMTLQGIDAAGRALGQRLDTLMDQPAGNAEMRMWTRDLRLGGDMARNGYDSVGYQLNGWLLGSDASLGHQGFAGFAFGQSNGFEQLKGRFDRNRSRSSTAMFYGGWNDGRWYTRGHLGIGYYRQDINRQLLLGTDYQGVWTRYDGTYGVAYGESGMRFRLADTEIKPFVDIEYARLDRSGFAEQGAGGFGLKADAQTLGRWQSGLGVRATRHWDFGSGRSLDLDVRAERRRTLAANGDVFDASFVGIDQWHPVTGVGLSRHGTVFGLGLNAQLSDRTALTFGYNYLTGDRGRGDTASAKFALQF